MLSQRLVNLTIAGLLIVPKLGAQDQPIPDQPKVAEQVGRSDTLAELSRGQLIVIYENGELTIKAKGVPLLEVLRKVCSQIGAKIEAPPGSSETTFADLGPGPAGAVVASLLMGSNFNYAVQGSQEDPNALARLVLIPISGSRNADQKTVLEASEAPPPEDKIDPKEAVTQMKGLIAEAKGEIANMEEEGDSSLKDGAAQLVALLENSMDSVAAAAGQIQSVDQPAPSEAPANNPPPRQHHRRR